MNGNEGNKSSYRQNWRGGKYPPYNRPFRGRRTSTKFRNRQTEDDTSETAKTKERKIDEFAVCPIKCWPLYFPSEKYNEEKGKYVRTIENFYIRRKYLQTWKKNLDDRKGFEVEFKDLLADENIRELWPSLADDIHNLPEIVLPILSLSMHQLFSNEVEREWEDLINAAMQDGCEKQETKQIPQQVPLVFARLMGFEPQTPFGKLKANCYGKLVSVTGTVVRVSNIKPLCMKMAFKCCTCNEVQTLFLSDGKYAVPTTCASPECRSRTFLPDRSSNLTETIDWQNIRIQELVVDDRRETGRIPRTIECELTHDLVDNCVPGDVVVITGVVKTSSDSEGGRFNKDKCTFMLHVHANSVKNCKGSKCRSHQMDANSVLGHEFTIRDLYAVEKIHSECNIFHLMVTSLCPTIYGHEMVKAGLVLGLFGGKQKYSEDRNRIPVRGDPHVLVVGDPGLGKSQLLQACANVAPRGVYVSGNTTTTSGLTVTVSKGSSGSDYALEAGALVLADQGCCCIDEFDKMSNQHQALLEVMEQQCISIAKAGIICNIPARASILAAANPVGGHYNQAKTMAENIKLNSALLSRFDLVFILLDKPNEDVDNLLSKHIMAMHSGQKRESASTSSRPNNQTQGIDTVNGTSDDRRSLLERFKLEAGAEVDPLPHQLLRKYIAYARMYVQPRISPEAASELQKFYLDLRKKCHSADAIPITTRQLESLIRLTEARARMELREIATEEDALDVIDIMKWSMTDTYSDSHEILDLKKSQHCSGTRSYTKKFISALNKIFEETSNNLFTIQQMKEVAKDLKLSIGNFDDFLQLLNNQNYLLKKGPRVYQLQT